jgi:GAF domain-containing protein
MNADPAANEARRLETLRRYAILDTPPEAAFDDLVYLAAHLCQAPMALLGFIDADRLWVKARYQLNLAAIPRPFAWLTLKGAVPDLLVVPDAQADPRYAQHPMVTAGPRVRFYAGVPLLIGEHLLGALEVMGPAPRALSDAQAAGLRALARQAVDQLELRRISAEQTAAARPDEPSARDVDQAYDAILDNLARALDLRDREVEGHLQRVAGLTVQLARALGVTEDMLPHIRRGALLHDIGKLAIPDSVLLKPSALTEAEWSLMHLHPVYGYEMLEPIKLLKPALDIPHCHHERWDGQGYPHRLAGTQIPLAARIFAVVDVWDALRTDRPYRQGWPEARVRDYLRKRAGADFDPQVIEVFLQSVLS